MIPRIVERVPQYWRDIKIFARGDAGVAGPEMSEHCLHALAR